MKKTFLLLIIFLSFCEISFSQDKFVIQNKKGTDKIPFNFINNLIIIPVEINGVKLSFILDTGVSKPILFNFLNISDSLHIKNTKKIYLRGLGKGTSIEALKSSDNILRIGEAVNLNQDLFAVFNTNLNFSSKMGIPVHGIIGYDLFRDFVVEINYSHKYIRLTEFNQFKNRTCRSCETLNLEFYKKKPYINGEAIINKKAVPVKLLIDSGGSDALWLFEDKVLGITSGESYFDDFLGYGLSGSVHGKRSKIDGFSLKQFKFNNVNTAFPDSSSIGSARHFKSRNGSISGNILKRFNITINYEVGIITLKKNSNFKDAFSYNKSGLELEHGGLRLVKEAYNKSNKGSGFGSQKGIDNSSKIFLETRFKMLFKPAYTIVEVREGSVASDAGLKLGDVILAINGRSAYEYSLQEVVAKFYEKEGRRIKLKVDRDGQILIFEFKLESLIK